MAISPSATPGTASSVIPLKLPSGSQLTVDNLRATHDLYARNIREWTFLMASYNGVRDLVEIEAITKHERESPQNFARRMRELYSFGYTRSIVDLFTFYLFKGDSERDVGPLGDNSSWMEFEDDCDLFGTPFEEFITEQARYASIYGHVGILVDKPQFEAATREEELKAGVHPYLVAYHPPAILDWQWRRDEVGKPYLAFLKLHDDDGFYRLWWKDRWEVWREVEKERDDRQGESANVGLAYGSSAGGGASHAELVNSGENRIGEIPFVWLYNLKSATRPIGVSDVHDIARIDLSITRDLSQGEEVITYAAFPMLLEPGEEASITAGVGGGADTQDVSEVGTRAVRSFDPDNPEGTKPEWLKAEVKEPIEAILGFIERKVMEIYRASNAGGMASTEISTVAKSGAAIVAEFQLLNSKLVMKGGNLQEAELGIVYFWTKLEEIADVYEEVSIRRPRSYDVHNLAQDLENTLTSLAIVTSRKFEEAMQKSTARRMLPGADEELMIEIDKEIEAGEERALLPRRVIESVPKEEQRLKLEGKRTEVDKAKADVEKTKAEAKEAEKPKPPAQLPLQFGGGGNSRLPGRAASRSIEIPEGLVGQRG